MAGALTARTFTLYGIGLVCLAGLAWWAWLIWDSRCRHTRLTPVYGDARIQFECQCRDCGLCFKRWPKGGRHDGF